MTNKHTPGPWKIGMLKDRGKYAGCTFIQPTSGSGPGFAFLPPGREDVQKANARLIAEAPAMLDALRDANAFISAVTEAGLLPKGHLHRWTDDEGDRHMHGALEHGEAIAMRDEWRAILARIDG